MENSASDLSNLQKEKLCSSEQFIDAHNGSDIYNHFPNEKAPATVEGGVTMPNQGSTSGTKTLNQPTNWTDDEYHTSIVQASEVITTTGPPSFNQIGKRRREDIEKKYHDRQMAKVQCMKMMSDYDEMSTELQKLKLERERYVNLNEQMCRQLQSDSKIMEQLRAIVSSLTSSNASLNLQLDSLYRNVLEVYESQSELKAEKDELKRENEYLKNHLTRWKKENVQWKRDKEYTKNILEIRKDELRRMKDEVNREEENSDNPLAEH